MLKNLLFTALLFSTISTFAQEVTVSNGFGYGQQSFYLLSDDNTTSIDNESWDIAFTTIGLQDAGIHINESANFSMGTTGAELEVYEAPTKNWDTTIDATLLTDRLYNDDKSWTYGGAFNQGRNPMDPFDFGWGTYNFMTNMVSGDKIFVVKLRDGSWKKIQIQGITITTYNFRYADLDGSNEVTQSLDKKEYENGSMAYFSFETGEFIAPQDKWDFLFTRYASPVTQMGMTLNYVVTGVLSRNGVEIAEANNVDPATVDFVDYQDSLSEDIDAIGYDWKSFQGMWMLDEKRAYFVKDIDETIWKINFTNFGGSGNGNSVFDKCNVATSCLASTSGKIETLQKFAISPNPAQGQTQIVFDWNSNTTVLKGQIFNLQGQVVRTYNIQVNNGLNAHTLNDLPTQSGMYILKISDNGQSLVSKLIVE